jgi:hypothetical protein
MDFKKYSKEFYIKWIAGTAAGLLIIVSSLLINHQNNKIDKLEDELYLKTQNEQRASDYYSSTVNIKTIQTKFNTLNEYPILKDSTISMNHTYNYTSDSILGLKKQITLSGRGELQYSINVNLSGAIITQKNNTIIVEIEKPYIDIESVHLKDSTLIMDKESANWIANKYDGMEAQRLYYDSFNISGRNKVLDLYNTQDKQKYLEKAAITEVQNLIRTLNLTNCTIVVNIIK